MVTAPAHPQDPAEDLQERLSLSGEDLPQNLRLLGFVASLRARVIENPTSAERYAREFGLRPSRQELSALVELYGDFDERQQEAHQSELRGLEDQPELRWEISQSFALERSQFIGAVFGAWLRLLADAGHDAEAFVVNVLDDPTLSVSMGFRGRIPSFELIQERARGFGEGFEEELGKSVEEIVSDDREEVQR